MRRFSIRPRTLDGLLACRLAAGVTRPATIARARIESVERALECAVPDDLIAAWAAVGDPTGKDRDVFSPEGTIAALRFFAGAYYVKDGDIPRPLIILELPDDTSMKRAELTCVSPERTPANESQLLSVRFDESSPAEIVRPRMWRGPTISLMDDLFARHGVDATHLKGARRARAGFRISVIDEDGGCRPVAVEIR